MSLTIGSAHIVSSLASWHDLHFQTSSAIFCCVNQEDPELKPFFEQARSGDPQAMMKLMSDPDLTKKVMAKLGQVPQPSQAAPGPAAASQEAPEINNLLDAAR